MLEVMAQHDGAETLHYVDPPYVWETRSSAMHRNRCYTHELDAEGHAKLFTFLGTLKGSVVLSGYPHDSYDDALTGWRRVEIDAYADGARDRVEVLWLNPLANSLIREATAQLDLLTGEES